MNSKNLVVAHGLVWWSYEYNNMKDFLWWYGISVHAPHMHDFPSSSPRWHTVKDLVKGLKWYIDDNIEPSEPLILLGNSMGTHIIDVLLDENADILNRTKWYIYVSWCSMGVEHGNEDFNKFMEALTWDATKKGLPALKNGIAKLMELQSWQDVNKFIARDKNFFQTIIQIIQSHIKRLQWQTVEDVRNKMLAYGIWQSIWLDSNSIWIDTINNTKKVLGYFDENNKRNVKDSISTLAMWLPRKQEDFKKSEEILQKIYNHGIQSMVVGSVHDPMVKRKNQERVAEILHTSAINHRNWWHAVQLSPDALRFLRDSLWFIQSL